MMRQSREAKARSHEAITHEAARLFRLNGIESTSVADVMAKARLTHGGFYRHFDSKEALAEAALRHAFDGIADVMDKHSASVGESVMVADYAANYLSDGHMSQRGEGCPVPALASEIARSDERLKQVFGEGAVSIIDRLAAGMKGAGAARRAEASRLFAMLVGATVLARAGNGKLAQAVLDACREKLPVSPSTQKRKTP